MEEEAKQPAPPTDTAIINRRLRMTIYILAAFSAIIGGYLYIQSIPPPKGMYDAFARCIADTSTTFYGAWWCPHCAAEKTKFGDATQYLPYVECANPDQSEKQVCIDEGVKNYPTWVFPDGSRLTGTLNLNTIAQKTGCALPTST